MGRVSGDHDTRAGSSAVLAALYPQHRVALDHVDDLIAGVRLLRPGVRAGPDGHHRGLASLRLLQDLEELALRSPDVHDRPVHCAVRFLSVGASTPRSRSAPLTTSRIPAP